MQCDHVILCGNHWLQSDDHLTDPKWTGLAQATLHTRGWCDKYAREHPTSTIHVMHIEVATERERKSGLQRVKTAWLGRFEELVRNTYRDVAPLGLWVNAHMYFGWGLTVADACDRYGKSLNLEKVA